MQILPLLDMAHQQASWLSARQSAVATNIANANTPDYRARDVTPFEAYLGNAAGQLSVTQPSHLLASGEKASTGNADRGADHSVYQTSKPVVLETELLNQTDLRNQYELNTAIVKAFHRMFMSVARG